MDARRKAQREADEIAKKDLLVEAGISYGQFYRWKRMHLIPEAWFRRRSTFTGQEAFLPRRKVLERIRRIQQLKDQYPLEEIAAMLSPDVARRVYDAPELEAMSWVSPRARSLLGMDQPGRAIEFLDLLRLAMVDRLLADNELDDEQIRLASDTVRRRFDELAGPGERSLAIVERNGETIVALYAGGCVFDSDSIVRTTVNLTQLVEEIKINLRDHLE